MTCDVLGKILMAFSKRRSEWKPAPHDARVKPWKHEILRVQTEELRRELKELQPSLNIPRSLDILFQAGLLTYEISDDDDDELQSVHALTRGRHIKFRQSEFDALLNPTDSKFNRVRFTAPHEICHALKHHHIGQGGLARVLAPRYPYESAECEANAFSAHLLMPISAVKQANYDPNRISEICQVSWDAASNRSEMVKSKGW